MKPLDRRLLALETACAPKQEPITVRRGVLVPDSDREWLEIKIAASDTTILLPDNGRDDMGACE